MDLLNKPLELIERRFWRRYIFRMFFILTYIGISVALVKEWGNLKLGTVVCQIHLLPFYHLIIEIACIIIGKYKHEEDKDKQQEEKRKRELLDANTILFLKGEVGQLKLNYNEIFRQEYNIRASCLNMFECVDEDEKSVIDELVELFNLEDNEKVIEYRKLRHSLSATKCVAMPLSGKTCGAVYYQLLKKLDLRNLIGDKVYSISDDKKGKYKELKIVFNEAVAEFSKLYNSSGDEIYDDEIERLP